MQGKNVFLLDVINDCNKEPETLTRIQSIEKNIYYSDAEKMPKKYDI